MRAKTKKDSRPKVKFPANQIREDAECAKTDGFGTRRKGSAFSSRKRRLAGILAPIVEVFVASGGK
jgi:hypothetical protein